MNLTQWIAVGGSILVAVGSAAAIVFALRGVRDQLRVTVFLTYTERYATAMGALPFEARRPGGDYQLSAESAEERARVFGTFRDYFNLCAEEMWLRQHRRIDRATWQIWERGMQQVALFPPFREAWLYLAGEYDYYKEFQSFVTSRLLPESLGPGAAGPGDAGAVPAPRPAAPRARQPGDGDASGAQVPQ
jgi:hypothetical protein